MRMRSVAMLATLSILPVAIAACGQVPGAASKARTGAIAALSKADFFPTKPGSVWQYEVTGHPPGDPYVDYPGVETVVLKEATRAGGRTHLELQAIDDYSDAYRFPTLDIDENGVTMGRVTYYGPMAESVDGLTMPLLRFPLAIGVKWNDGDWFGQALKQETVKVPAGTFETWKFSAIGTYDQAYTVVGDYWVAPGVGIVKSELNTQAGTFESVMIPAGKAKQRAGRKAWPVGKRQIVTPGR